MAFYIFHQHTVCLVDCVDLICSSFRWWEGFGSSSLATLPLNFNCGLFLHLGIWVTHWGLLLRLPWRTRVCPSEGQVWRWCSCLGCGGSGSSRYSGELAVRAAGNIVLQKGMAASTGPSAPVLLPGEPPSLTEKPGRPQSTVLQSQTLPK